MAGQINRSQLQKQSSVDHEDGSEVVNEMSEITISSVDNPDVLDDKDQNAPQPEILEEYNSLKTRVDLMYEKNGKNPVTDDLKEPMLNFIMRTLASDKTADYQHLQDCYCFLNTYIISIIATKSCGEDDVKLSVEWENQDSRARMIMHKLCAFFGLQHNIIGQQYSSTIKIDYEAKSFIHWDCNIKELSRYHELKKILDIHDQDYSSSEAKVILKRTSSNRQQSLNSNHNESRSNSKTYEDRHNRYYQLRKQLGLPQGEVTDQSGKKNQKSVKQMHSMPTHDSNSRDQLMRVKMDAQQRSATTDHEPVANYMDSSYSNSDFMSGESCVLFQDSTSGVSSPSEVFPMMMQYPLSDDTLVYKLVPTKLSSLSADENVYIMPPGSNHPILLLNDERKPFRYRSGSSLKGFCVQSMPLYLNNHNPCQDERLDNTEGRTDQMNQDAMQTNNNCQSSITLTRQNFQNHDSNNFAVSSTPGASSCKSQPQTNMIHIPANENAYHGYVTSNLSNVSNVSQQFSRPLVVSAINPTQDPTPPCNQQSVPAVSFFPQLPGSEYAPVQLNNTNLAAHSLNPSMQLCAAQPPSLLAGQPNLQTYFPPGVIPCQTIMLPPQYFMPPQNSNSLPRCMQPQSYGTQVPTPVYMQAPSPVISQAHQSFSFPNVPTAISYPNPGQYIRQHIPYLVEGRGSQNRGPRSGRQSNVPLNAEESQ